MTDPRDSNEDGQEREYQPTRDEGAGRVSDAEWVPDDALAALNLERQVNPERSFEQIANTILREALPIAVSSLVHLSQHAANDKTRLEAAKYIVERNLGRLSDVSNTTQTAPWDGVLADCITDTPTPAQE